MYCQSLAECFEHISAYTDGDSTGFPLIVNVENYNDFQEISQRFSADESKQCIFVSENTFGNGLPNLQEVQDIIVSPGKYVVVGISQSMMLQGEAMLDLKIDELIGNSIRGHAIILLDHCRIYLEKYRQRDLRLENRIILLQGETSALPQIRIAKSKNECFGVPYDNGIRALLSHLERITDSEIATHPMITVVTPFSLTFFKNSMFAVSTSGGIYDAITSKYADISGATEKQYGTNEQWAWLFNTMKEYSTFVDFVVSRFDSTAGIITHLGDVLDTGDSMTKWLLWLSMKVFGVGANHYLSKVLNRSRNFEDFEKHIYQDLLDISYDDRDFEQCFIERKQLIARLPENLPEVSTYCTNVGRHGKNAVFYLTDATETEEFTFMQLLDHYEWQDDELLKAVQHGFPELALYMKEFRFDSVNTKLPEKDSAFRATLTEYFNRYKIQKVKNHIDEDFLDEVNTFAIERPFYKLQPRSSIISSMNKNGVQGYFFDALGVEYLAYIQAKCEEYGLIYDINIGHCELPSITEKNKEFKLFFDTKDIGELDKLKHHSQIYDYQTCKYPIHVFRELEIIDRELRRVRAGLVQSSYEKAAIISDHGASRLAVIYKHESGSPLELEEKGEHSGRCCPAAEDPKIEQAAYEDGYAILGNYERFKGGRKANLEVHGGASLEEVVVPVITVSLRPDNVVYYFVDPVVKYKVGRPSTIELFSNVPMKQPRIKVDGIFYDGVFGADKNHALFTLTEQKRVREYSATVYEGNSNTGVVLTFRIERNTKTRDLFGL